MWLFHPLGFCSVVIDRERPTNLLCRGRVKRDLEHLFPDAKIETTPGHDYRFRTSVPRAQVAARVAEMVAAIDYDNFKDACPDNRHVPYLRVWSVMHGLQQDRAPKRRRKRRSLRTADVKSDVDYYEWMAWA